MKSFLRMMSLIVRNPSSCCCSSCYVLLKFVFFFVEYLVNIHYHMVFVHNMDEEIDICLIVVDVVHEFVFVVVQISLSLIHI